MKLRYSILIVIFLYVTSGFGQTVYQNLYGTGGDDYGNKILNLGSGYVIAGSSTSGAGGYDAILERFDTAGNLQWTQEYGGSRNEYGTGLTATNTGFVVTGRTKSFSSNSSLDVYLLKTNTGGAQLWVQGYHSDSVEYGTFVANINDTAYIITGQTNGFGAGGTDAFLIRTDSSGNPLWERTYGSRGNESGSYVQPINAGAQYVLLATTDSGNAGMSDVYVVLTGPTGLPQYQLLIGGPGDEEIAGLAGTASSVIFGGTTGSTGNDKFFLASLNTSTFTLNWAKTYGGSGQDQMNSLQSVSNNSIVMVGSTTSFGNSNGSNGLVIEVDTLGNVIWSTVLGDTGHTYLNYVTPNQDGSVNVTGSTDSFSLAGHNDVYMARISSSGFVCGPHQNVTITPSSWTPTVTASATLTGFSSDTASFTTYSPAFSESSYPASTGQVCSASAALAANAGGNSTVCEGTGVQIGGNPTASGGSSPYTYAWSGAGITQATTANPLAQPTGTTTYAVTVTDHAGATATAQVTVSVDTPASVTFILSPDTFCSNGGSVTLSATPGGGTFSGSGVTGSTFSPSSASLGIDTLVYTYTDGAHCSSRGSAWAAVRICAGINNLETATFTIAPNPSHGNFEVDFANNDFANAQINIIDLTGRVVYTDRVNNSTRMKLSLGSLLTGPYIIQITGAGQTVSCKLIIE
jgi:hypothetical protein